MLKNKAKFATNSLAGPAAAGLSLYNHIIRSGIVVEISLVQSEE